MGSDDNGSGTRIEAGVIGQAGTIKNMFVMPPPSEAQLQHQFAQATGAWCPRGAREAFEELMAHEGVTADQVGRAWNKAFVGWNTQAQHLRVYGGWFERVFTVALDVLAFIPLVALVLNLWSREGQIPQELYGLAIVAFVMSFGALWFVHQQISRPLFCAVRIGRAMESQEKKRQQLQATTKEEN